MATATALAQATPPDSPALQALVSEIHQLRQDLQATTVAAQRVQIALFRLQSQTAATARATSRFDEVRSGLSQAQSRHRELAQKMQQIEETQRNSHDPAELKTMAEVLPQIKYELDREAGQEQRLQASEAEAASQLRTEQAKLNDLQDQLDKLDRILDSFSKK
jgi:chromosome segregation ATPase